MCRLMAMTATTELGMKRLFFNQLMTLSLADDSQVSGSGVTDGVSLYKSGLPYTHLGLDWLDKLDGDRMWLGHVRKASRGTDAGTLAAHPYHFTYPGGELIAAHNGFIADTGEAEAGDPNVDSYRAFKRLIALAGDRPLSAPVLNEWIETFGYGSEWTFMFYQGDEVFVARGIRPIFYMSFENGYLVNTSIDALMGFRHWIGKFWPKYKAGKIIAVSEHHLLRLTACSKVVSHTALKRVVKTPEDPNAFYYALEGGRESQVKLA